MKVIFAILLCIFGYTFSYAGKSENAISLHKHQLPSKGYYSIHKKASIISKQKKNKSAVVRPDISKGFYVIPSQQQKKLKQDRPSGDNKPVISKGYYTIGNNRQKLK